MIPRYIAVYRKPSKWMYDDTVVSPHIACQWRSTTLHKILIFPGLFLSPNMGDPVRKAAFGLNPPPGEDPQASYMSRATCTYRFKTHKYTLPRKTSIVLYHAGVGPRWRPTVWSRGANVDGGQICNLSLFQVNCFPCCFSLSERHRVLFQQHGDDDVEAAQGVADPGQ